MELPRWHWLCNGIDDTLRLENWMPDFNSSCCQTLTLTNLHIHIPVEHLPQRAAFQLWVKASAFTPYNT